MIKFIKWLASLITTIIIIVYTNLDLDQLTTVVIARIRQMLNFSNLLM